MRKVAANMVSNIAPTPKALQVAKDRTASIVKTKLPQYQVKDMEEWFS